MMTNNSTNSEGAIYLTSRAGSGYPPHSKRFLKQGRAWRGEKLSRRRRWPVVYCCSFAAIALYSILLTTNNACLASGYSKREEDKAVQVIVGGPDSAIGELPIGRRPKPIEQAGELQVTVGQSAPRARPSSRLRRGAQGNQPQQLVSEPLRAVSGSKSEPPSRPQVDWSKQRPYFGADLARNVSVELGKTAYLSCKVFELGDKTVLWLRPRENEILTAGRYTYIGDPRFAAINNNGSQDWILEIKDVGLNDSTSYECQVSTDPKMSVIINLQVRAAKARIRQGEHYVTPMGSSIEFVCEIGQKVPPTGSQTSPPPGALQQTYWYHNGNLLNYAQRTHAIDKNFSIEWDPLAQSSRFKLFNVQPNDTGNYTCKPTSAEPATIRLTVKKINKGAKDRSQHNNGYHSNEAQRNRQHYGLNFNGNSLELNNDSSGSASSALLLLRVNRSANMVNLVSCLLATFFSLIAVVRRKL